MGFLGDTLVSNGCNYTSIETLADRNQPFLLGTFAEEYQLFTAAKATAVCKKNSRKPSFRSFIPYIKSFKIFIMSFVVLQNSIS